MTAQRQEGEVQCRQCGGRGGNWVLSRHLGKWEPCASCLATGAVFEATYEPADTAEQTEG